MNQYIYDTHIHTSEVSPCARVDGATVARLYKQAGYSGIVITDHYFDGYFETLQGSWKEKVDAYLQGYRKAYNEGEKIGLKVILGIELRFNENDNDYLIYGIDEAFLKEHEKLYELDLKRFFEIIKNSTAVIYQAHPFRSWATPANPEYLHGVEVFNGNPRHDSMNHKALEFAEKYGLKKLSGSDFHQTEDLAIGGVVFSEAPTDSFEFAQLLSSDRIVRLISGNTAVDHTDI